MKVHNLKTWPEEFQAVFDGTKKAELRLNDRDFKVGDVLVLEEYSPGGTEDFCDGSEDDGHGQREVAPFYTDRSITVEVTHVQHGGEFGLAAGHVMLSIERE